MKIMCIYSDKTALSCLVILKGKKWLCLFFWFKIAAVIIWQRNPADKMLSYHLARSYVIIHYSGGNHACGRNILFQKILEENLQNYLFRKILLKSVTFLHYISFRFINLLILFKP